MLFRCDRTEMDAGGTLSHGPLVTAGTERCLHEYSWCAGQVETKHEQLYETLLINTARFVLCRRPVTAGDAPAAASHGSHGCRPCALSGLSWCKHTRKEGDI